MTSNEKRIVGQILYLASDKRHRVLLREDNAWLERKLVEIRRLAGQLPLIPFDPKKDQPK